jgi:predicted alpha/beta hydrolase family esterase
MDVLFLQGGGAGAYDEDTKLASSLQRALGSAYTVHYPRMPDEDAPEYGAWKARMLEELAALGEHVVLAGHSLGASFLLKVLAEEGLEPRGVFLAAPPFWGEPDWDVDDYALPEVFALPENLPIFLYHSRDDAWVPFAHLARYAAALPQVKARKFDNRGHQFNDDLSEMAADIRRVTETD